MSEAPPVADAASEFRGSAPLVATEGKQEAAGATVQGKVGKAPAGAKPSPRPRAARSPGASPHPTKKQRSPTGQCQEDKITRSSRHKKNVAGGQFFS